MVVYDGGAPGGVGGINLGGDNRAAQGFTLAVPGTFDAVRLWVFSNVAGDMAYSGPISYAIYGRSGSAFGSLVTSGTATLSGASLRSVNGMGPFDFYQYDFGVDRQTLGAGTYFIELFGVSTPQFYWEKTAVHLEPSGFRSSSSGELLLTNNDLAFQLRATSTVPEPSTYILVGTGLLTVIGVAARRRHV